MRIKDSIPDNTQRSAFTLAEVVMAVFVVALVFGGVLTGYVQATKRAEWSGYSLAAQAAAIQQIEQARSAMWDPVNSKDEITNLNLTGMSYSTPEKAWKGSSTIILDLPISGTNAVWVTNFISVSPITLSSNPLVIIKMLRVDTVWLWRNTTLFTNTLVTYRSPNQ